MKRTAPERGVRLGMLGAATYWSGRLNVAGGQAFLILFHLERHLLALLSTRAVLLKKLYTKA